MLIRLLNNAGKTHAAGANERAIFCCVILAILVLISTPLMAKDSLRNKIIQFDIPQQRADKSLIEFAEQADLTLIVPFDEVREITVNRLVGKHPIKEALKTLLSGTGLKATVGDSIRITIVSDQDQGKTMLIKKPATFVQKVALAFLSIFGVTQVTGAVDAVEPDSVSEQSATIEEVVVTARKREESLQDVPISISVFGVEDLKARSITTLKQLGGFVPNFTFSNHPSLGSQGAMVFIRGVGQADPSNHLDPGVGVYIDNVYVGRMQGFDFDLMGLERVEVLRGPQGTLFGKNTIGGAVNIVTAKPTDDFAATAEITTGRFNRIDGKVSVNIPLIPGKLAVKFAGASRNRDGYGTILDFNTGNKIDESGDEERLSGRALFDWKPTDSVGVLLSLDAAKTREAGPVYKIVEFSQPGLIAFYNNFVIPPYGDIFATDSEFTSYGSGFNTNDLDTWGAALTIDWGLGSVEAKSITAYRDMEALSQADLDGSPHTLFDSSFSIDQDQTSQEFQLSSLAFDDRLSWLAGLYYFKENSLQDGRRDIVRELADNGLDISFTERVSSSVESYAAFGEGTFRITDKFDLIAGLRYTKERKEITRMRFSHYTGLITVPADSRSASWEATSGRFGLEYKWNDNAMSYITASRGFKSGGINARSTSGNSFVPFDPEYIWTYETGLKSSLLNDRLRFNAAFFYSDYTDQQFSIAIIDPETNTPISIVGNAAASEIKGFEIELMVLPVQDLILSANVGYTDAKYTEVDPTAPITKDDEFAFTPKWTVTLSGQYEVPIKNLGNLIGRLDYAYRTKTYYQPVNDPFSTQDSYGLLNARLTLASLGGTWEVSLFGTNLTDEKYITTGLDGRVIGFALVQYARPQEWGATLTYHF